ncbi:hypothetical protein AKO1_008071 [Acrasis kona]|uniref:BTB domain-containing protein n=1 Tax=Acrasis kona TaxID=1008807 RepID=A0AAW2YQS7_9EUKA
MVLNQLKPDMKNQEPLVGLTSDIADLFNDKETSDVTLYIIDEANQRHDFYCHKFVLAARNAFFDNLFSLDGDSKEVFIDKIKIQEVMYGFLNYLYTNVLQDGEGKYRGGLIAAADAYEAVHLKVQCGQIDKSKLTNQNWVEMLKFALKHQEEELINDCLEFAGEHIEEYITNGEALKLDRETILLLLDRDSLSIDELTLFEFLKTWVETHGEKEPQELFSKIRICLVDLKTLKTIVMPTGYISKEDYLSAVEYFAIRDTDEEPVGKMHKPRSSSTKFHWVNNHESTPIKNYSISNASRTVTKELTTTWDLIVHSSSVLVRGISYWQIRLDSINNDRSGTVIGVVNNRKHPATNYSGICGLGMTGTGYNAQDCGSFNKGDVVGVVVDFVKDAITFYKNGKRCSQGHNVPSKMKRIWAVVFLYYSSDQISLVDEYALNELKN